MKVRKVPMRMCVGCREMKPKRELLRVVRSKEGVVTLDRVGKAPGRGAYVCTDPKCFEKAYKAKMLERALEHTITPEVYEQLREELEAHE